MGKKEIKSINSFKKAIIIVVFLLLSFLAFSSLTSNSSIIKDSQIVEENIVVEKNKEYYSYKEVATYIHTFKILPVNYITKEEARQKGWDGGNPQYDIDENVCIGGDRFANLEKQLPDDEYYECDVDYNDENRGPNRLIYTKDGKVYYTNDHYETFIKLY